MAKRKACYDNKSMQIKRLSLQKKVKIRKMVVTVAYVVVALALILSVANMFMDSVKWTRENPELWQQEIQQYHQ